MQRLKWFGPGEGQGEPRYVFFCPGCRKPHEFKFTFKDQLTSTKDFNYDLISPTTDFFIEHRDQENKLICEAILRNGKIIFTHKSNHVLAGCETSLPPISFIEEL